MIEIVNEPRPADKGEKPPRNIRQIGNISENHIVYMEDYVYRFLHKKDRKIRSFLFMPYSIALTDSKYSFTESPVAFAPSFRPTNTTKGTLARKPKMIHTATI